MDVMMPKLDGFGATQRIRGVLRHTHLAFRKGMIMTVCAGPRPGARLPH